ncbi:MAG: electron transport complex subunit RsxD [Gammaproteobacteria bacterium]|nr:electron transport complex subunit RsxD [Gammaproteobacteria bacterium]
MHFKTPSSPHFVAYNSVSQVMLQVIYALIPGSLAMIWYFGWGILINIVIAVTVAVGAEAAMLLLRNRPLGHFLGDYSAIVTGWLLALALPPLAPWWLTIVGILFAIVIAKHLYGGLGFNPFNPAMIGYVVLIVSFPVQMTSWTPPGMLTEINFNLFQSAFIIFTGQLPNNLSWDAVTMATPLDTMRTQLGLNLTIEEIGKSPLWGDFGGRGWEWIGNWYLLGGAWLTYRRVIDWQIPAGMLGGLITIATLFYLADPDIHPFPAFHVFSGGALLGAFFIATDPVTASTTPKGRLIYGAGIGCLVFIIRTWGGYPDGVAFSVLLMNLAVPAIDYYTKPRVYGKGLDGS